MINRRVYAGLAFSLAFGSAAGAPITFNTALPVGDGKVILREQVVVSRSGDDPLGAGREANSRSLLSLVAYGVNAKLAVFGVLPYTSKEAVMLGAPERSNDGLGDLTMETNELGDARSYYYDASGRLTRRVDRNEQILQYTHDELYRTTSEKWFENGTP